AGVELTVDGGHRVLIEAFVSPRDGLPDPDRQLRGLVGASDDRHAYARFFGGARGRAAEQRRQSERREKNPAKPAHVHSAQGSESTNRIKAVRGRAGPGGPDPRPTNSHEPARDQLTGAYVSGSLCPASIAPAGKRRRLRVLGVDFGFLS